jgi:antitoxin ParD1/3/4
MKNERVWPEEEFSMSNINVSLPEPMREWIEAKIKAGRYGNLSEYVRDLIRRDQGRETEDRLDALLLDGLESLDAGKGIELTPKYWEKKRQDIIRRHNERTTKKKKKKSSV